MSDYQSHTDQMLLSLLQNSDQRAFTELYNRYWEKLLARGLTQLNSLEDTEELLHDIFVKLWNRRTTLDIKYSFHTYIAAMLKYEILRLLAERRKKPLIEATTTHIDKTAEDSTSKQLDFMDLQQQLEASVRRLPDKCQLVFRMSRQQGLSQKEIARELNITTKTVENHINRALRILRSTIHNISAFFL